MKTIGLLGGMSWESSAEYYRVINQEVRRRLGGHHSAPSVMVSLDFHEIERLQTDGEWATAAAILADAARRLVAAGAELVVMCTNTMHLLFDDIAAAVDVPMLHIAEATAAAITADRLARVGLLGTRYTMEMDFYRRRLEAEHGFEVQVPDAPDRATVDRVIFDELVRGEIRPRSREVSGAIIDRLVAKGAEGIVLGCTELELLIDRDLRDLPLYPTARLHAVAAVDAALS